MTKSAREGAARHRRREWRGGLLRRLARAAPVARRPADRAAARWCACATIFLGLGAGGAAAVGRLPPARPRHQARRLSLAAVLAVAGCLASWISRRASISAPRAAAAAAAAAAWAFCWSSCCCRRALVQILRHALLEARHAVGENRLALARQLFLGVEQIEQIARIEAAKAAGAAGQRARQRDQDGSSDQTLRAAHGRFLTQLVFSAVSFSRPAAATPAALRRASAGSAASRRHWQSDPATCRAAVVSLARQADSASNSRAVWRKVAPGAVAGSRRCSMSG